MKTNWQKITSGTDTRMWLDSAALEEMRYALDNVAVGVTCNPVIALRTLKLELPYWEPIIRKMIADNPTATEDEIGWMVVRLMSTERSRLLLPAFEKWKGKYGRLSIQTDPRLFRDKERIVRQAVEFSNMAPNIIVKIPVLTEGLKAIEEATYQGVSVNATVSFAITQVVQVAEAVMHGFARREKEGMDCSHMGPVCTIMLGRTDDYCKEEIEKLHLDVDPELTKWCGIAIYKKAFKIYTEKKYPLRLLAAAFRTNLHVSELVGGEYVLSPAFKVVKEFNDDNSYVFDPDAINKPVDPAIVAQLRKIPTFRQAYDDGGMTVDEFAEFGPARVAMNQFCASCNDLAALIRAYMI